MSEKMFPSMQSSIKEITQPLEDRIARLESALRFYAELKNYDHPTFSTTPAVMHDRGERARVTLYGRPEDDE